MILGHDDDGGDDCGVVWDDNIPDINWEHIIQGLAGWNGLDSSIVQMDGINMYFDHITQLLKSDNHQKLWILDRMNSWYYRIKIKLLSCAHQLHRFDLIKLLLTRRTWVHSLLILDRIDSHHLCEWIAQYPQYGFLILDQYPHWAHEFLEFLHHYQKYEPHHHIQLVRQCMRVTPTSVRLWNYSRCPRTKKPVDIMLQLLQWAITFRDEIVWNVVTDYYHEQVYNGFLPKNEVKQINNIDICVNQCRCFICFRQERDLEKKKSRSTTSTTSTTSSTSSTSFNIATTSESFGDTDIKSFPNINTTSDSICLACRLPDFQMSCDFYNGLIIQALEDSYSPSGRNEIVAFLQTQIQFWQRRDWSNWDLWLSSFGLYIIRPYNESVKTCCHQLWNILLHYHPKLLQPQALIKLDSSPRSMTMYSYIKEYPPFQIAMRQPPLLKQQRLLYP